MKGIMVWKHEARELLKLKQDRELGNNDQGEKHGIKEKTWS